MPKANLILSNGTSVTIEGSTSDVAKLLEYFSGQQSTQSSSVTSSDKGTKRKKKGKAGPVKYISELREEGFFKSKRTLSDIQKKLEELGHIYALSSLSPIMLHIVKNNKTLRRIKEGKNWIYVDK